MVTVPQTRNDFHVAIFCALPLEAENVQSVFDKCWEDEGKQFGKALGDQNSYTTGAIGNSNIVLVHMPEMGINSASLAAAGLQSSFLRIQLALVVGICGVVPVHVKTKEEIVLGDIIISTAVTQYDFGRKYPNGFQKKNKVEDSLGRASPNIRSFLSMLQTRQNRQRWNKNISQLVHSDSFQCATPASKYPGVSLDRLYEASYLHQHRPPVDCDTCSNNRETCTKACHEIGCEEAKLIRGKGYGVHDAQHSEMGSNHSPSIHLGRFGSANTVMKSGAERDQIARDEELIAFEMEGAAVWEQYPTLVIKSACDYADSHKNKAWQDYAAAMAAACVKVFLTEWIIRTDEQLVNDNTSTRSLALRPEKSSHTNVSSTVASSKKPEWYVPFDRIPGFVARTAELETLQTKLFDPHGSRVASILGLGGVGKSRLALELAYRIKSERPECWVLWIQAAEQSTFENDILQVGMKLGIPNIEDKGTDFKALVKQRLSMSEHRWVLILDNADDETLWGRRSFPGSQLTSLAEYLPSTAIGSILITTRSRQVANFLAEREVIELPALAPTEAAEMFAGRLEKVDQEADEPALSALLDHLAYLPLALVQAASYINKTQISIRTYANLMAKPAPSVLKLLSKDFGDRSRYYRAINPVATTWLISFNHIQTHHPLAAGLLSRMACFHEKGIPQSLLLDNDTEVDDVDYIDAVAVLTGYSFVTKQSTHRGLSVATEEMYDMHRLVRLAVRNWLEMKDTFPDHMKAATLWLAGLFPKNYYEQKSIGTMYLPHAQSLCEQGHGQDPPELYELLRRIGKWFMFDGRYDEAVKIYTRAVTLRRETVELLDRNAFEDYGNLGNALRKKGEWSRAEKYISQAFNGLKALLGLDDPATLTNMLRLSSLYRDQGRLTEAEELGVQVVEGRKRVLGEEHIETLICTSDLALTYWYQDRIQEAEELGVKVLEAKKRALGEEHPETLISVINLASVYLLQGRLSEAEELAVCTVERSGRLFGSEHPQTLNAMARLATTYWKQGRVSQAEELEVQVLEVRKRVQGEEHPDTLVSLADLASTYHAQNRVHDAIALLKPCTELYKKVYGPAHPDTQEVLKRLARWQDKAGTTDPEREKGTQQVPLA